MSKHEFIAAEDKDFAPTFRTLCLHATVNLFGWCRDIMSVHNIYEEYEDKLLKRIPDLAEELIDAIYGYDSKLNNKEWVEMMC